jgi:Tfp pilus assembly PilM family ATPase
MARTTTALGVELTGGEARLVLLESGEQGLAVHTMRTVPAEELARAFRSFPRRPAGVVCAVPLKEAAVRILSLPPTTEENLERVVTLEAETALPLDREDLALAHHMLGMTEQSRVEVLVASARHHAVQDVLRRVNALPWVSASVTVSAIALLNALHCLRTPPQETVRAALRIEAGYSELVVMDRTRVLTSLHLPNGSGSAAPAPEEREPAAVAAGMGAEREVLASTGPTGLMAPVLPWVAALSQQVRYALQALTYEPGVTVDRLYLCGEGATQPGVEWQLSERLEVPLTLLTPPGAEAPDGARYALAYGCAVQAAGAAAVPLNLTPARVSAAREVEQRRQTRFSWAALAASALVAGGLVFGAALHNRQREVEEVNRRLQGLRGVGAGGVEASDALKKAVAAVDEALEVRVPPDRMFSVLSSKLPPGTWLAELTYNAESGCVVRGYSLDQNGAQRAQMALLQEQMFDEVTLDYRNEDEQNGVPVWGFQISCKLRPEERRPQARPGQRGTPR